MDGAAVLPSPSRFALDGCRRAGRDGSFAFERMLRKFYRVCVGAARSAPAEFVACRRSVWVDRPLEGKSERVGSAVSPAARAGADRFEALCLNRRRAMAGLF